jgi:hypothetical protein
MKICAVDDCNRPIQWRSWCCTHYARWLKTGVAGGTIKNKAAHGSGHLNSNGYVVINVGETKKLAHILIAEKALGKTLPSGAQVHHLDENKSNNDPKNLVICPDAAYHKLLHQRQRAFDACGNYGWRKCQFCKTYDDPARMWTSRKKAYHTACASSARAAYKQPAKDYS